MDSAFKVGSEIIMDPSILKTIKKMLGISDDDSSFDNDVVTFINTVFMTLNQLGVGPVDTFHISGETELWTSFLDDFNFLETVKTYIYLKVKLLFDPPASQVASDAMERKATELEYRLLIQIKEKNTV